MRHTCDAKTVDGTRLRLCGAKAAAFEAHAVLLHAVLLHTRPVLRQEGNRMNRWVLCG